MGVKRIEDMIRTRQFGDVKEVEMIAFLGGLGFEECDGSKHHKMKRKEKGPFKTDWVVVPRHKDIRLLEQIKFVTF